MVSNCPNASRSNGYSVELLDLVSGPFFASAMNECPVARVVVTSPKPDWE